MSSEKMDEKEIAIICAKSIEHWGVEAQMIVAIEELSELINEVSKKLNGKNKRGMEGLVDEVADVQIMIEQLQHSFGIHPEVNIRVREKFNKLEKIIDGKISHPHKPLN